MATIRATALPDQVGATMRKPMVDISTTELSATSSASTTPSDSPTGTPRLSPSNSSLTSMDSNEALEKPTASTDNPRLVDAYGNEFVIPDYTIKQIRDAIPAHCFERSALIGGSYIARDVFALASIFLVFHNFVTPETVPNFALRTALWTLYTVLQGFFGTGLWVIAHECGHQSFSASKTINDTVGWVLHSALLVPYFSWKISHGKHHKATGNLERDMVFVPPTREIYSSKVDKLVHQLDELTEDTPIASLIHIIVQQLGGWPAYLITNVTGHNYHEKQSEGKGVGKSNGLFSGVNHFNPSSPLYERKDEKLILLSDLGIAITATVLYLLTSKFGFANMFTWYFAPYLWVNNWLG
jgi:omega-6 fatty acid desaturase (delta-12 desaturase)